jgi:hypothetical protein
MKYRKYVIGGAILLLIFSATCRFVDAIQQKKGIYGICESLALPLVILIIFGTSFGKPKNPN